MTMPVVEVDLTSAIDALLPQTQCRLCGFDGCLPYADAIAEGVSAINRCPPGGQATVRELAALLRVPELPLDQSLGPHRPPNVARIDEALCIGCTLCIQACPVDAIMGAPKLMHAVLTDECTGCDLCIEPCPVDCIEMVARPISPGDPSARERADRARRRYLARTARLATTGHPTDLEPQRGKLPITRNAVAGRTTPVAARNSDRAARMGKSPLVELAVARAKAIRRRMDGPGRHP